MTAGTFSNRYSRRCSRYQKVYLLWGPPGNGKSSFLQALAVSHSIPLFILQLSNERYPINKALCRRILSSTAEVPCIVAVEDAESCFLDTLLNYNHRALNYNQVRPWLEQELLRAGERQGVCRASGR